MGPFSDESGLKGIKNKTIKTLLWANCFEIQ